MARPSVTLLFVIVGGIAGDKGPFIQFQGSGTVNTFGDTHYKAGVFYPLSAFNSQVQPLQNIQRGDLGYSAATVRPVLKLSSANQQREAQKSAANPNAARKNLLTNGNASPRILSNQRTFNEPLLTNEVDDLPYSKKLPIEYHPEERLSLNLIQKMKKNRLGNNEAAAKAQIFSQLRKLNTEPSTEKKFLRLRKAKKPEPVQILAPGSSSLRRQQPSFLSVDFNRGVYQYTFTG